MILHWIPHLFFISCVSCVPYVPRVYTCALSMTPWGMFIYILIQSINVYFSRVSYVQMHAYWLHEVDRVDACACVASRHVQPCTHAHVCRCVQLCTHAHVGRYMQTYTHQTSIYLKGSLISTWTGIYRLRLYSH